MTLLSDIGFISKAAGFHGEVLFVPEGPAFDPELRFVFLYLEGKPVPFFIEKATEKGGNMLLKFEDVEDEAAAKKLSGFRIFAEASALKGPAEGMSFQDLLGFEVVETNYGSLGPLLSIQELPGQVLGRCEVKGKEVLFPLPEEFVVDVDTQKKIIRLELPEGLLSIYLEQ